LVAPDSPGINAVPEIRAITSKHHTTVLNGTVTPQVIDQYVRNGYNSIHFAGHSTPERVELSGGTYLDAADVVRFAHAAKAKLIVFNSCEAGKMAAYAVAHGIDYAIASTIKLEDSEAWEFPSSFYAALANGAWRNILTAFREADSGNGEYTLVTSPALLGDLADQVDELRARMTGHVPVNAFTLYGMGVTTLLSLVVALLLVVERWYG
jgi:hypothetical protein